MTATGTLAIVASRRTGFAALDLLCRPAVGDKPGSQLSSPGDKPVG